MSGQVTDPSREMAGLIDLLRKLSAEPEGPSRTAPKCWKVMSEGLGVAVNSAEYLELLAAVRDRLGRLDHFVTTQTHGIEHDIVQLVRQAIRRFSEVFSPAHQNHEWQHALSTWVTEADATTFRVFSRTMADFAPLKRLSEDERQDALAAVRNALADIDGSDELTFWDREALAQGYRRLELVLQHFEFFGHERLTREIVVAQTVTHQVQERIGVTSGALRTAWNALAIATILVEVFAAPSTVYHSLGDYHMLRVPEPSISSGLLPAPQPPAAPADKHSALPRITKT